MAGAGRTLMALAVVVRLTSIEVAGQEGVRPAIDVRISLGEVTGIDVRVIQEAKREVSCIYSKAGIAIAWNGVGEVETEQKDELLRRSLLIVMRDDGNAPHLVSPSAIAMAQATPEKRGRVAFVFWTRLRQVALKHFDTLPLERMLGLAIAHELGHLLLPAGHGQIGLMKESWNLLDLRRARRGELLFTAKEAELMRSRIARMTHPGTAGSVAEHP